MTRAADHPGDDSSGRFRPRDVGQPRRTGWRHRSARNNFLSKALQTLTRARLVISHRCHTTGSEFSPAHRAATVLGIVEAVKGPIGVSICLGSDEESNRQPWCATYHVRPEAQDALASVPRSATIEESTRDEAEHGAKHERGARTMEGAM